MASIFLDLLQFYRYRSQGLFFDINVTFFLPPVKAGELIIPTETAAFRRTLWLPRGGVTGEAARAAVAAALRDLHISDKEVLKGISEDIVNLGSEHLARARDRNWIQRLTQKVHVKPHTCYQVDELPPITGGFYIGASSPSIVDCDDIYDEGFRFVQVSRESVEGLVKRKEKTEDAVNCAYCLNEAPVGSELTGLPCSHRFHMDCILEWLEKSKLCPVCEFELP